MTTEITYGTATGFTITLNSLADGSARESTAVSNTSTKAVDYLISGTLEGAASADGTATIYAYGQGASGKYSGSASGTDAAFTDSTGGQLFANLKKLDLVTVDAATTENFEWGPVSLAAAFGGVCPDSFGVVVHWVDKGTAALHSSNNAVTYQSIKYADV